MRAVAADVSEPLELMDESELESQSVSLLSLSLLWLRVSLSICRVDKSMFSSSLYESVMSYSGIFQLYFFFSVSAVSVVEDIPGRDPSSLLLSYIPL